MTEPTSDNGQPAPSPLSDNTQVRALLELRSYAIATVIQYEHLLESMGHPVQTAIITRAERRRRLLMVSRED